MEKLRICSIGLGGMGRHHTRAHKELGLTEIVAFCDIIPERAEMMRDEYFPDAKVYTDYREMIEKENPDAVDIATPNYLHSPMAVFALEHGCHVFCEKPDAVSVAEAEKMRDAAEKAGKILMVMRNNRYYTPSVFMKQFIADGKAGDIYAARCGWQRRRGIPGKGGWFTTKAQSGGGPLIDLGVHMIDLAIWAMGNPTPVAVSGCTYNKFADDNADADSENAKFGDAMTDGTFDVEDLAMGFIRFDNGACLQIEFSWASNVDVEKRYVELRGTKAGFSWRSSDEIEVYSEEHGVLTDLKPQLKGIDGHAANIAHFIDCVQNGTEPDFTPQQGVNMIKILTAIYESAQTGKEVLL
ncbi:MAG: Gfo/Idh/MocA family oxidoreductase [Clostridia bacterium]|nr:Gfo/Idh/MocA family oxidoreductase [Clostridia bacterium]